MRSKLEEFKREVETIEKYI